MSKNFKIMKSNDMKEPFIIAAFPSCLAFKLGF